MPKQIGSQIQYSFKEAGVEVLKVLKSEIITWDKSANKLELWGHSQDFAGSVLRYKNKNYEFIRSFR